MHGLHGCKSKACTASCRDTLVQERVALMACKPRIVQMLFPFFLLLTLNITHVDAKLHARTYCMCVCTSCTNLYVLHMYDGKMIVQLDNRDK